MPLNGINRKADLQDQESFYGLPKQILGMIKKYKGIDKLYAWQDECLRIKEVINRNNLIYALPTSGGKTLVAEILMLKELVSNKKNAIFVLPFVALVQEKLQSITPFALDLDFFVEEYAAEKGRYPPKKHRKKNCLYVCTIEKAHSIINSLIELKRLNEIGIIVIDEIHLLGEDGGRGATLENMLTKIMFMKTDIQIIGMSATIENINEIAGFLDATLYQGNFRPTEIKEFIKCEKKIWCINNSITLFNGEFENINYNYSQNAITIDPDYLGGLVMDVVPSDSCLIFCPTKKSCENVALLLTKVLFKSLERHKEKEKMFLQKSIKGEEGVICSILNKAIRFGVAYHHSGLTSEERRLIEDAYKARVLCVLCCTSTLAAGVNLPAKRVILRSPYIGKQFLTLSRYKQMIGRAGRAGMQDSGESILICQNHEIHQVKSMLESKMDESLSSLHIQQEKGIDNLLMSSIFLSIATTRGELLEVLSKSLLKIQAKKLGIDWKVIADDSLKRLLENKIVKIKNSEFGTAVSTEDFSSIFSSDKKLNLELCTLGRAALKGSMNLTTAQHLYKDIKIAQNSLILTNNLHLLYIVTPYEASRDITMNGSVLYDVVINLPNDSMQVARLLGIDENVVIKFRSGVLPKNVDIDIIKRFYVTLILNELWNRQSLHEVADKFQVNRGVLQNLLAASGGFTLSVVRFCQELEEFWAFAELLSCFSKRLLFCSAEIESLMQLPHIQLGRARQLFKAGFKTVQCIAKTDYYELKKSIPHMSSVVAKQIIEAAKMVVLQKIEELRDEVEDVLEELNS